MISIPRMSEDSLQIVIAQYLKLVLPENVMFFHVPNGGKRNAREAAKLKRMGTRAGVADFVFFIPPNARAHCIELKTEKGSLSANQNKFAVDAAKSGAPYEVCRSVGEVERVLIEWGVPLKGRNQ